VRELKRELMHVYGPRLRGVYIFGSYARGTAAPAESDLDILIVLDEIPRYGAEIEWTGELASRVSLAYDVTVSRVFVSEHDWNNRQSPFLDNVREEALLA
jgi:predicted nucleotidyltransferase